mmetsp:Transcript_38230/g.118150  ORF Transcript_38230/g.118150 Transcript_38230/m.118150 type:complete len:102 (-) Transcript_38230:479-784(-)|eukprot:CAMPEP_0174877818 /NCGR_PEP_ID=MMETSP1114-20130205/82449_1 /TAXON_ID=312471 /ORGANISM="Neobodo designis, Strain CCAP 1951/1" /LENGTH=101 /DNA_ID=CAMNT_0016113205 /DNA_START=69 /DNA_END=374 /DNA_ORIENTATION=+
MFRRIATAAPAARVAAAPKRNALILPEITEVNNAEVRANVITQYAAHAFITGTILSGTAFWIALGMYERPRPSSEVGPAYWFAKFTLARAESYHAPAVQNK